VFTLSDEDAGPLTHIVCVEGELDAASHRQFEELIEQVVERGKRRIVVDLQEATFLDSTALSGLLAAARHLRRPNGVLAVVVGRHPQPRARFDLTGTGEVLNVCDSREEALTLVNETRAAEREDDAPLQLRLYVNGRSPNTRRAIRALEELRRRRLPAGADVEVIDIADQPELAETQRLLATPALVRSAPPPVRRIIGDLTNHEQVLYALDLVPVSEENW
jgi:circadian clock protein KaiB